MMNKIQIPNATTNIGTHQAVFERLDGFLYDDASICVSKTSGYKYKTGVQIEIYTRDENNKEYADFILNKHDALKLAEAITSIAKSLDD